ncbi:Hypothetical protein FKW44_005048, partial [Caligus rogercresseyi]
EETPREEEDHHPMQALNKALTYADAKEAPPTTTTTQETMVPTTVTKMNPRRKKNPKKEKTPPRLKKKSLTPAQALKPVPNPVPR